MRVFQRLTAAGVLAVSLATTVIAQTPLSRIELEIARTVDANVTEARALLQRVVNINSGSLNGSGVREVGRVFDEVFGGMGFDTRWDDGSAFNRAGHFIATRRGDGPHFLLIGHLDTVFEPDSPFQRYTLLNDSTAAGPGVSDMKGGDVIIVEALKALDAVGALDRMTITVVLIGDEESSGRPLDLARKTLRDAAEIADVAIAFENGDDNPHTAVVARRGFTGWKLSVTARPAHSSLIFRDGIGYGAIYEASRILHGFYSELTGEEYLTFNPGIILGGTDVNYDEALARGDAFGKTNVIAEFASVAGDLRTISIEQRETAKERMRAIVADHLPETAAEISFSDGYPPLAPTAGNRRLLEQLSRVSRDLGFGEMTAVNPGEAGAADISFTAGLVDMALDGLGLTGDGAHTVDETANLNMLPVQAKRTAVLLSRLSRDDGTR